MSRNRMLAIAGGFLLIVMVVVVVALTRRAGSGLPQTPPVPAPTATATATPRPPPPPPQPTPFDVALRGVHGRVTSNKFLIGRPPPRPGKAPHQAAERVTALLERYLNAMFVAPATRYTQRPLARLLSTDALHAVDARDQRALGVGLRRAVGGKTGGARAQAFVLHRGKKVQAVTLRYAARFVVIGPERNQERLLQSGEMLFLWGKRGWRAAMVDVRLQPR